MFTLPYVLLSILSLSFLIFIHELGHYFMARRTGMKVETFSIGFGTPIWSKEINGTTWQVGWLLFGGYVKIAGMDGSDEQNLYDIDGGFFQKSPWDRIKVAFMGPFVNILFAFLVFTLIWTIGGREKKFSEFTPKLGWVDPTSELYAKGVRPGDEITEYDGVAYHSLKDHIYQLLGRSEVLVKGFHVNYRTGVKTPFEYDLKTYPHPAAADAKVTTIGIMRPAGYIVYDKKPSGEENPLPKESPVKDSGIEYGDRILWVDGQTVFSETQLSKILNDGRCLLTVERGDKVFLKRVPRVKVKELRPDQEFKEELIDWKYEAGITDTKMQSLYAIPYNLTYDCVVQSRLKFIDDDVDGKAFPKTPFSDLETPLISGDKILAVDGIPVTRSYQLLRELQSRRVNIVLLRDPKELEIKSVPEENADFNKNVNWSDLTKITNSIGSEKRIASLGNLILLKAITPIQTKDIIKSPELQAAYDGRLREISEIDDPAKRSQKIKDLADYEKLYIIGLPNVQDRKVIYNPNPVEMFDNVLSEIGRTLEGLFSGALNPKWMSGPVGIVQVVQTQSMVSLKEALFWIGAISLNLGILNLLPLPVLDGGTILVSFIEMVTGKRINRKIYEKVVFVFAILLISFFIFVTFNDISRLFGGI